MWFCHDSDHDAQETRTRIPSKQHPEGHVDINFTFKNKTQRKYTPLSHKEISGLEEIRETLLRLAPNAIQAFEKVQARTASEFCIEMYTQLGLLEGIEVVRSSDEAFRKQASVWDTEEGWYYDTTYNGELVRANLEGKQLRLHKGGGKYQELEEVKELEQERLNPGWKKRFDWMQTAIQATHYVVGRSEKEYLEEVNIKHPAEFIDREEIANSGYAWIQQRK